MSIVKCNLYWGWKQTVFRSYSWKTIRIYTKQNWKLVLVIITCIQNKPFKWFTFVDLIIFSEIPPLDYVYGLFGMEDKLNSCDLWILCLMWLEFSTVCYGSHFHVSLNVDIVQGLFEEKLTPLLLHKDGDNMRTWEMIISTHWILNKMVATSTTNF